MTTERRQWRFPLTELRFDEAGGERRISGHPAVFNSWSLPIWDFRERVEPGAFADTIRSDDVVALFNHDPNLLLGRSRNGTLSLVEDARGLSMDVRLPDTTVARDTWELVKRGDVNGGSFGFEVIEDRWDRSSAPGLSWDRTLLKVRLWDVSPVVYPAYPASDMESRSLLDAIGFSGPVSGFAGLQGILLRSQRGVEPTEEERRLMRDALGLLRERLGDEATETAIDSAGQRSSERQRPIGTVDGETTPDEGQRSSERRRPIGILRRELELIQTQL